jgi:hypothetical protein
MSALKKGVMVTVGEWSPRERLSHRRTSGAETSGKEEAM